MIRKIKDILIIIDTILYISLYLDLVTISVIVTRYFI